MGNWSGNPSRPAAIARDVAGRLRRSLTPRDLRWLAWSPVVIVPLLALGIWAGDQEAASVNTRLRASLAIEASEIARLMDADLVGQLGFTAEDRGTAAYEIIRDRLANAASNSNARGAWSVARRDGTLLLGPATWAIDDPLASPPGTVYQQAPAEVLAAFDSHRAVTVGPYVNGSERLLSGLAPVLGQDGTGVVLVVGVAANADDAQAQADAARLPPLRVALGFLLAAAAVAVLLRRRNRRRSRNDLTLQTWILLPLTIAVVLSMAASSVRQTVAADAATHDDIVAFGSVVAGAWHEAADHERDGLTTMADRITGDPVLGAALASRDLPALRAGTVPVFNDLASRYALTLLDVVKADQTAFLRVGEDRAPNEPASPHALADAARTGMSTWGLEVGSGGSFTYGYVRPWISNGLLIGYLVLGIGGQHMVANTATSLGVDLIVVLDKRRLSQAAVEAGTASGRLVGTWAGYPGAVIVDQTVAKIPSGVGRTLSTNGDAFGAFESRAALRMSQDGRTLDAAFLDLSDVAGHSVGGYVAMRDVTAAAAAAVDARFLSFAMMAAVFGGVMLVLGSLINRAQRQLAGAFTTLRTSEESYRRQFVESGAVMLMIDALDGSIVEANAAATQFYGYSHDRLVTMRITDINRLPAEEVSRAMRAVGPHQHTFAFKHRLADGSIRDVSVASSEVHFGGRVILHSIIHDVTEQIASQALLAERTEDLRVSLTWTRAITEKALDAVVVMDPDGRVSYWNPAAERFFGYTPAEAVGLDLHELIAPARYRAAFKAGFAGFLQSGEGEVVNSVRDLEGQRRDGTEFPIQLALSAVNVEGQWFSLGIMRDVTGERATAREIRDMNDELAASNVLALEMTRRAEAANEAKSEFLANMSHEIRTPLNGVIGMTGLLLDTDLGVDQRRYAETVRTSGDSLLALLNDILDFSKMEAGKIELEMQDFDPHVLVDDLGAMLALGAHAKGLELICSVAPDVPTGLSGDAGRLRQVLLNLAGNALKFTRQGEIIVRASVDGATDDEVVVRFSIKDTGIGIAAAGQERLFRRFTQADASTTREYGGTGLGLAIVRQLVELMGGEVGVVSQPGLGSEFWFTARLGKLEERDDVRPSPAAIQGVRILVADDNATNREIVASHLASWGAALEEAPDGPGALLALHRAVRAGDPFRVVVLDMQMPGMDAADVAQAIKANPVFADTHILMMTSISAQGDARRLEQIGIGAYLVKPVRKSGLLDALSAMLSVPAPAGATRAPAGRPIVTRRGAHSVHGGTRRILVAEDNITSQQVATGILERMGLRVDSVANGAEAIRALEMLPYDLVLMDVQMPEIDGLEATRRIRDVRSAVANRMIPIIATTANAMPGDREKCLAAGMNDYITKPLSPTALAAVLERWLSGDDAVPPVEMRPAAKVEPAVFDRAGVLNRLMDDTDLARVVLQGFLGDLPRQIEALRTCLLAGDAPGVVRAAHTIQGASANVGGDALRAVALLLEEAARGGDLLAAGAALPDLEAQFGRLREAMGDLGDPLGTDPEGDA